MFALSNVVHLFTHEFARLGGRSFSRRFVSAGPLLCFFLWHSFISRGSFQKKAALSFLWLPSSCSALPACTFIPRVLALPKCAHSLLTSHPTMTWSHKSEAILGSIRASFKWGEFLLRYGLVSRTGKGTDFSLYHQSVTFAEEIRASSPRLLQGKGICLGGYQ